MMDHFKWLKRKARNKFILRVVTLVAVSMMAGAGDMIVRFMATVAAIVVAVKILGLGGL